MSTVLDSLDETILPPACACGSISLRKSLILRDHLSHRVFEPQFLKNTYAKATVLQHSMLIKQTHPFAVQVEPTIFLKTSESISSILLSTFLCPEMSLYIYIYVKCCLFVTGASGNLHLHLWRQFSQKLCLAILSYDNMRRSQTDMPIAQDAQGHDSCSPTSRAQAGRQVSPYYVTCRLTSDKTIFFL